MELGKISEQQCLAEISSGEVIISGPAEESAGKGAVIVPGEGVILRVNGEEVKDSCQVYPRDKVEVEALHLQEPARVAVKVAADKMAAEAVYLSPQEDVYKRQVQHCGDHRGCWIDRQGDGPASLRGGGRADPGWKSA